ncbi:MAG: asparagine synthase (glutamine-hydrolyzing) [Planctomycetes bacterium]|nr:asparagine synthase (glutamine-hydrolyzing) [Planctomycetota bacterium]
MCGIVGILGAKTEESDKIVRDMADVIAHRGPDGEGYESGETYAVGHRRLAIIDLALGAQPMFDESGRYLIAFNGEIYNYLELREGLAQRGFKFSTFSDTEVLLATLIVHGEEGIKNLGGMFAFFFIDTHTGKWILARDHFGVKPLYYANAGEHLIFASEIKALFKHPKITARRCDEGLRQYLTFQFCLGERTLFERVKRVEPGWYLKGSGGKIEAAVKYWDTDYTVDEYHTREYFIDRLRRLLSDSVRLQIRSDVPLGAYLSGGVDSSLVATLAADKLGSGVKTFNGYFTESPAYDESHYARKVAESIRAEAFFVAPTEDDFVRDISKLVYHMDEPAAGPGLFPQYYVSKLAQQHVKVVLGGQGGDEIFGGYARYLVGYLEQALKGAIFENQDEGKHVVTLASIVPNLAVLQQYAPLMKFFWQDGLFADMDARYFRLIDRSPDIANILEDDARSLIHYESTFEEFRSVFNHPDTKSYINKMTHFDQKTLLPALLQVEDRVSMAVSLESRVPLLDSRIVDLVCSMPPGMKFKGGQTKYILRKAISDILLPDVLTRKDKMGFPVPLKEWMQKGPVREFVRDTLLSEKFNSRNLFKKAEVEKLINKESAFGRQLWGILCLELWHRNFID